MSASVIEWRPERDDDIPSRVICAKCGKQANIVYDPPDPEVGILEGAYWTECCQVYYDECEVLA